MRFAGIVIVGALILLLSPLLIGVWAVHGLYGLALSIGWWLRHGRRGQDFLVVYSNSPKWSDFFSEDVLPVVSGRAIVVDISKQPSRKASRSLERRSHRYWGGRVEHTPLVIHFRHIGRVTQVRFYEAALQAKRGEPSPLREQLAKLQALTT
ncbi:hypothetical protein HK414_23505 [Ramlibacter terrae]|uniref:Uncharacterized protein n=1 Tax=Ramlibacter terrae TaxID=2732511 RepID=A0ABX6P5F3_9BURK|nr:hypothetical protein HK414_23505 [Ramlibacter terrae]